MLYLPWRVFLRRWFLRLRDVGFSRDSSGLFRIRVALPAGAFTSPPHGFEMTVRSSVWRLKTPSDSLGLVSTRLLSWGFQRSPLHRHEPAMSTPTLAPSPVSRFRVGVSACPCQKAGPVPSSWFFTTWTVCSIADPAGLLHPAADPGVHRVAVLVFSTLRSEKQRSFHDA